MYLYFDKYNLIILELQKKKMGLALYREIWEKLVRRKRKIPEKEKTGKSKIRKTEKTGKSEIREKPEKPGNSKSGKTRKKKKKCLKKVLSLHLDKSPFKYKNLIKSLVSNIRT